MTRTQKNGNRSRTIASSSKKICQIDNVTVCYLTDIKLNIAIDVKIVLTISVPLRNVQQVTTALLCPLGFKYTKSLISWQNRAEYINCLITNLFQRNHFDKADINITSVMKGTRQKLQMIQSPSCICVASLQAC
jgi:hypothetical protein